MRLHGTVLTLVAAAVVALPLGAGAQQPSVSEFKKEATRGKDPDLKAWTSKTLPTLEDHLETVQQLQARVKSASRAAR
jgi:Domain of unknown function (DUF4142)